MSPAILTDTTIKTIINDARRWACDVLASDLTPDLTDQGAAVVARRHEAEVEMGWRAIEQAALLRGANR